MWNCKTTLNSHQLASILQVCHECSSPRKKYKIPLSKKPLKSLSLPNLQAGFWSSSEKLNFITIDKRSGQLWGKYIQSGVNDINQFTIVA